MSLVLDSSVTLAWCFEDEGTTRVEAVMQQVAEEGAVVPGLWRYEVANGLQMAVRRKRIEPGYRDRALALLADFDIRVDSGCEALAWTATLELAARYDLTVYDGAFLELAQRRRVPLATMDAALARAAGLAGVTCAL